MKLSHSQIALIGKLTNFENIYSLSSLVEHIYKIGNNNGSEAYTSEEIKGDIFEIFSEYFIKKLGPHNDINVHDYSPGGVNRDCGVDGVGVCGDGNVSAIQIKYKHDPHVLINYEEASKFFTQATLEVKVQKNRNMLFITTSEGFNHIAKEQMADRGMRLIGRRQMDRIIGQINIPFWDGFRNLFNEALVRAKRKQITRMDHQNQAIEAFNTFEGNRAQIIMPTGAGKTLTEHDIVNESIKNGGLISVVCAPNIALVDNLLQSFWEYKNNDWVYRVFSSGKKEELEAFQGDSIRNAKPTTSQSEIEIEIKTSIEENRPLLLFSTYHSLHKIGKALNKLGLKADILIADEAHNLTRRDWSLYLRADNVPFKKLISFTATRKVSMKETEIGMNNPELFGEVIFKVEPKEMIEKGCIVPPRVVYIKVTDSENDDEASVVTNVIKYFRKSLKDDEECRIIISCTSASEAHDLADSVSLREQLSGFNINAITSLAHRMHGKTRTEIFKEYSESKNSIIFHYDMISEGVDLPGTTAVMPLRLLPPVKSTQLIGRALRITSNDRKALRENKISVGKTEGWEKPFGFVIIYEKTSDCDLMAAKDQLNEIIYNLRTSGYNYDVEALQIIDESTGSVNDEIEPYSYKLKKLLVKDIENRVSKRIEEEELAFSAINSTNIEMKKNILEDLDMSLF